MTRNDTPFPRVTFGIIVLNGEPFTRYCLRQIYPYAHQIIAVEGAAPSAAAIASPDGHSTDATLQVLREFQLIEDRDNKLIIVTAEDEGHGNGFWPGEKDEQSQAYAKRATGDYLWQVDIDEFYRADDIERVLNLLKEHPETTAISFKQITFWGGFDYIVDSWYLKSGAQIYHRLFKWDVKYQYITHRPPTVVDEGGKDLRTMNWLSGNEMVKIGIFLYHYSLLFPKQVQEKCEYYDKAPWVERNKYRRWADNSYFKLRKPFRVHNVYSSLSWLERFHGRHPEQIIQLRNDIHTKRIDVDVREKYDIEILLRSTVYQFLRACLKLSFHIKTLLFQTIRKHIHHNAI